MTDEIIITSDGSILEDIELEPETVLDAVIQNIAVILATTKNTIPYRFDFGINGKIIGRPLPVIQNMIVSEVFEQITTYEPRAIIGPITVTAKDGELGNVVISVKLEGVNEDG